MVLQFCAKKCRIQPLKGCEKKRCKIFNQLRKIKATTHILQNPRNLILLVRIQDIQVVQVVVIQAAVRIQVNPNHLQPCIAQLLHQTHQEIIRVIV